MLLGGTIPIAVQQDVTHYVDPFIATGGHGHYPGAGGNAWIFADEIIIQ